jgi:hypothetical protein
MEMIVANKNLMAAKKNRMAANKNLMAVHIVQIRKEKAENKRSLKKQKISSENSSECK